ncbi:MAG: hypothetical protein K2I99_07890 [Bacteroidaceae bacterium]|nr:hypothetical protein [Bacteroidaceae bacterium]
MMKYFHFIINILLLLCLLSMPYGYYMLVRFVSMVAFGVMAYRYYEQNKMVLAIVFGFLVLLFQPFIKIALGRTLWNVVDVIVAILLLVLLMSQPQNRSRGHRSVDVGDSDLPTSGTSM